MGFPPSSLKGQSTSKLNAKFNLQVPLNQATDLGGIDALIETNNRNVLVDPGFETGTVSNWIAYADAAGVAPVDGIGGSPSVTITASSTLPLSGSFSGLFTKDASNRQGQGISKPFIIDDSAINSWCKVTFNYSVDSGTFTTTDMRIYFYDVTNNVVITPQKIIFPTTSSRANFTTYFLSTSATNYRLILHVASASALAWTLKLDNFEVKLADQSEVPVSARANGATTSFSGATTLVFSNEQKDTHAAYNPGTGEFTCPESGDYIVEYHIRVNAVTLSTTQTLTALVYNGVVEKGFTRIFGNGASNGYTLSGSVFVENCARNDVLTVQGAASTTVTLSGGGNDNYVAFYKVTNT